jgi:hypothetical protein
MPSASETEQMSMPAWAHRAGILDLGPAIPSAHRCDASDRAAVCERIARYCWAYDERRIDRLAECFAADAVWEGSVLGQVAIGPFEGRGAIVEWLSQFWPHQHDQRRHMLLNTIVEEQSGDRATTQSYLLLMASTGEAVSMESMGFYRTHYRLEDRAWRITRLTAGFDKPFWPGSIEAMSARGRARHGIVEEA